LVAKEGEFTLVASIFTNVTTQSYRINSNTNSTISNSSSYAFWHWKRTSSTNTAVYKNGSLHGTDNSISTTGRCAIDFFVCAYNNGGSADGFSNKQFSVFGAGATLTGKESALYIAYNNYYTSL